MLNPNLLLLLAGLLLLACEPVADPPDPANTLLVLQSETAVYSRPDIRAPQLTRLTAGDLLFRRDTLAPTLYRPAGTASNGWPQAWLGVVTSDSLSGWILSDTSRVSLAGGPTAYTDRLLRAVLGPGSYTTYREQSGKAQQLTEAEDIIRYYATLDRSRQHWQAAIQQNFPEVLYQPTALRQIQDNLPALHIQITATNELLFYHDYRYWIDRARRSAAAVDDSLMQLYVSTYPVDSIEHAVAVWQLREGAQTVHSLLGQGVHYRQLAFANTLLEQDSSLLGDLLWRYKQRVLGDILHEGVTYWEPTPRLVAEIDSLLATPWPLLWKADRVALEARRAVLLRADSAGIQTDYRSGRYD